MWKLSQKNFQGFKIKAFSLLEITIVILIIAIIFTFAIPKFTNISNNSNLVKLKSEYTLILNGINNYKTNQVLLGKSDSIDSLDDAKQNSENENLFEKVIKMPILSTNNINKKVSNWIKISDSKYSFIVSSDLIVDFALEDSNFNCISDKKICKELY